MSTNKSIVDISKLTQDDALDLITKLLDKYVKKLCLKEDQIKSYGLVLQIVNSNSPINNKNTAHKNEHHSKKPDGKKDIASLDNHNKIKINSTYICPKCNKKIVRSYKHKHELTCSKFKSLSTQNSQIKEKLPEWERIRRNNDIFDRGLVVLGGGYGQGKNRKH